MARCAASSLAMTRALCDIHVATIPGSLPPFPMLQALHGPPNPEEGVSTPSLITEVQLGESLYVSDGGRTCYFLRFFSAYPPPLLALLVPVVSLPLQLRAFRAAVLLVLSLDSKDSVTIFPCTYGDTRPSKICSSKHEIKGRQNSFASIVWKLRPPVYKECQSRRESFKQFADAPVPKIHNQLHDAGIGIRGVG